MYFLDWRFLPLFDAVSPATAYSGTYQPALVVLSVVIACVAAYVALSMTDLIARAYSLRSRIAWSIGGAISMGGGIWSMHFIGMLAFQLPCGVSYDPIGTLISMIPGMLASGIALNIISQQGTPSFKTLLIGALFMGGGIGAMHYVGMASMEPGALMLYDPSLVAVSVIVAVALAFIALAIRFYPPIARFGTAPAMIAAAVVMGCAVSGMHYTAMQAATFFPDVDPGFVAGNLPKTLLALGITAAVALIAASTLTAAFAGRQSELADSLKREITRREDLESDTQSGRARLQAILDGVVDGIVTMNRMGVILQWSTGAEKLFGYSAEEAVGSSFAILLPGRERSHLQDIGAYLATCQPKVTGTGRELPALRKDGTEFRMEVAVNEVLTRDGLLFTAILRDITERKRSEAALIDARRQAEEASDAKSQFLATMSHEIRTPMNGIIGMANLLNMTSLTDRQRHLITNLSRSGQSLLSIINDILDFSKIEAGRFELFEADFDPCEVLGDVSDVFCERCGAKGLELIYYVADDVPARLKGDPVRLRQILINLVGNAVKFTERGEILIQMSVASRADDAVVLSLSVDDTGIGIEASKCAQVFQSFRQVDNSMTRSRGGTGLGLAISKQLVELMGGSIGVESELGRGSRFFFSVKCKPCSASNNNDATRQLKTKLNALLLDSNAVSSHVMSLYLASWNVEATAVSTIAEADEAIAAAAAAGSAFRIAIVDVKSLGLAGIDFVRSLNIRSASTKAVLMIGMDGKIDEQVLESACAHAMLTKPVRPQEFYKALCEIASGTPSTSSMSGAHRGDAKAKQARFDARILVAEDNPVNQDVATGILEAMGCKVVTAPNGRSVVQRYLQERFDLILMDCEMPILDGFEATQQIRKLEQIGANGGEALPRTPIIALTAHALADVRDKCLAAGMDDFLVKPFDQSQITVALRRWIGALEGEAAAAKAPTELVATSLDEEAIQRIRAVDSTGNDVLLKKVVSQFATSAPPLVAAIREKCTEGDGEALWRAAHSLKSSAAALGAKQLSIHCADIEALAKASGAEPVKGLLDILENEFVSAMRQLQKLVGKAA